MALIWPLTVLTISFVGTKKKLYGVLQTENWDSIEFLALDIRKHARFGCVIALVFSSHGMPSINVTFCYLLPAELIDFVASKGWSERWDCFAYDSFVLSCWKQRNDLRISEFESCVHLIASCGSALMHFFTYLSKGASGNFEVSRHVSKQLATAQKLYTRGR